MEEYKSIPEDVYRLVMQMRDQDEKVRWSAMHQLADMGTAVLPHLVAILKNADNPSDGMNPEYLGILGVFSTMGPEAAEAIPVIIPLILNGYRALREIGCDTLGDLGSAAIPTLIELLQSKDVITRRNSAAALGNIGSEAKVAVPYLVELLNRESNSTVRNWTIGAIQDITKTQIMILRLKYAIKRAIARFNHR